MRKTGQERRSAEQSWLPTDPKQIALAIVLILLVVGAVAFVLRYQASQPKPLPKSVYEEMYRSMYGRPAGQSTAGQQGPVGPPQPPGAAGAPASPSVPPQSRPR